MAPMKTLVVGGTGGIGGFIALELIRLGQVVTLAARNRPRPGSPVADLPILLGDYAEGEFSEDQLRAFDTLVFAAGNDPRQLPKGSDPEQTARFYERTNSLGVPRFLETARRAGVARAAYIGSFYPQARPDLVAGSSYIQSRLAADEGARALAAPDFHVVSLNAPWIIGAMPTQESALYAALARWAKGAMPQVPLFAPPAGLNFMSVQSLSDAVIGALTRGENGRGYLVGGENLYLNQLFEMFFRAAGRPLELPVRDEPHPIFADAALLAGRTGVIFFEPEGVEALGYAPNDVERTVRHIVATTA